MRTGSDDKQFMLIGWLYLVLEYPRDIFCLFVFNKAN